MEAGRQPAAFHTERAKGEKRGSGLWTEANRTGLWSFERNGRGKNEATARSIRPGVLTLEWGLRERVSLQVSERPIRATSSRLERASGESPNGEAAVGKLAAAELGGESSGAPVCIVQRRHAAEDKADTPSRVGAMSFCEPRSCIGRLSS